MADILYWDDPALTWDMVDPVTGLPLAWDTGLMGQATGLDPRLIRDAQLLANRQFAQRPVTIYQIADGTYAFNSSTGTPVATIYPNTDYMSGSTYEEHPEPYRQMGDRRWSNE